MKVNSFARITLLAGAMALAAPVFAAEPTIKEVYAAAQAGNYVEAQAMMDQVLKAHPNSASAHFVEAELLAKQGKFKAAEVSLARAEAIAPGLPKVNPTSVSKLKTLLAEGEKPRADYTQKQTGGGNSHAGGGYANGASPGGGIPWGTILIFGGGLLGFIWLASRFMQRRAQQTPGGFDPAGYNPGAPQPGYPPGGYPQGGNPQQGYPQPGYGQPQNNGMGSRIMGGLATGAALGAGLVAGEAIARQFTGGSHGNAANADQPRNDIVYDNPDELLKRDDMGGNNFGVSGGWDDSGGGGGDSAGGGGDWD